MKGSVFFASAPGDSSRPDELLRFLSLEFDRLSGFDIRPSFELLRGRFVKFSSSSTYPMLSSGEIDDLFPNSKEIDPGAHDLTGDMDRTERTKLWESERGG